VPEPDECSSGNAAAIFVEIFQRYFALWKSRANIELSSHGFNEAPKSSNQQIVSVLQFGDGRLRDA